MGAFGTWWGLDGSCLLGTRRGSRSMCTRRQCYIVVARSATTVVRVCLENPRRKIQDTKNGDVYPPTWKYVCSTLVSVRGVNRAEGRKKESKGRERSPCRSNDKTRRTWRGWRERLFVSAVRTGRAVEARGWSTTFKEITSRRWNVVDWETRGMRSAWLVTG